MQVRERIVSARYARELLRNPALAIWCLFLVTSPFYVLKSGLPQPGDMLVFLLLPFTLARWDGKLDVRSSQMVRSLLWFTVWVCLVNFGWAVILGMFGRLKDFIIHPFFYIFNMAVFLAALILARDNRERFLRVTVDFVFVTVVMLIIASVFHRAELYRTQLFFNNPNQLGYYALLSACLFAMSQRRLAVGKLRASIAVTGCAYLAILSASRASLAGILVLLFVLLLASPKTIILASLASFGLLAIGGPIEQAIEFNQKRAFSDREPKRSFAEVRGYNRIWEHPEYLLFGAGEGAYQRFVRPGEAGRELHASFGSVLFGYGVVGMSLFLAFALRVVRGAPWRMTMMLVPALMYTFAHQGLRFTMFWVLLAAFVVLKDMPEVHAVHVPSDREGEPDGVSSGAVGGLPRAMQQG